MIMRIHMQSYMANNNNNYARKKMSKTTFKGRILTADAFAAEQGIIEKIKTMPSNIFKEQTEFKKFCKNISITPRISVAITKS